MNTEGLRAAIKSADVVISLLPAPMHPQVADLCLEQRKNMVTASYVSPHMHEINDQVQKARFS